MLLSGGGCRWLLLEILKKRGNKVVIHKNLG
jgi:hypothetical protein